MVTGDTITNVGENPQLLINCSWLIKMDYIPSELFTRYNIYNDGPDVVFETEFCLSQKFNLFSLFDISEFEFLFKNLSGEIVSTTKFYIKGMNFEQKGGYDITTVSLKLIVSNK